ncbi:MAG: hypothetical protein JO166_21070 [Deltaproteobacteria bacterium]|nr:hypothetical protein [Deltaproteobacteria bacterium]
MNLKRFARAGALLLALSACSWFLANDAAAHELRWKTVLGVTQTGDQVGVGTGAVFGGAPWATTGGSIHVNLDNRHVTFDVEGLILAVGSVTSLGLVGVPIGAPGPVTQVKGTLVCDVDGTSNGGNSVDIDTPATALDPQGNAHFSGTFLSSLPAACSTDNDDAFLIRIVEPSAFANAWIAFGGVRSGE